MGAKKPDQPALNEELLNHILEDQVIKDRIKTIIELTTNTKKEKESEDTIEIEIPGKNIYTYDIPEKNYTTMERLIHSMGEEQFIALIIDILQNPDYSQGCDEITDALIVFFEYHFHFDPTK